jgi:hypothetical protein
LRSCALLLVRIRLICDLIFATEDYLFLLLALKFI